jgi:hypothetical protein
MKVRPQLWTVLVSLLAYDIFTQIGVPEAATIELRLHALDASAS